VTKAIADEGQRSGRRGRLAIVLDGKLYSAPGVEKEIAGGSAEISGSFTQREAVDLSNVLNNPLDSKLEIKEQFEVGAFARHGRHLERHPRDGHRHGRGRRVHDHLLRDRRPRRRGLSGGQTSSSSWASWPASAPP
jgi:hypothetical protein